MANVLQDRLNEMVENIISKIEKDFFMGLFFSHKHLVVLYYNI